jgi:hypothetical protein
MIESHVAGAWGIAPDISGNSGALPQPPIATPFSKMHWSIFEYANPQAAVARIAVAQLNSSGPRNQYGLRG